MAYQSIIVIILRLRRRGWRDRKACERYSSGRCLGILAVNIIDWILEWNVLFLPRQIRFCRGLSHNMYICCNNCSTVMTVAQHRHLLYPTLVSVAPYDIYSLARGLSTVLQFYRWTSVYVVYDNRDANAYCGQTARGIMAFSKAQASENVKVIFEEVGDHLPFPHAATLQRSATMSRGI